MQKTNQLHEPHYQRIHLPTAEKNMIFRMKGRSTVQSFGARSIIYKTGLIYQRTLYIQGNG